MKFVAISMILKKAKKVIAFSLEFVSPCKKNNYLAITPPQQIGNSLILLAIDASTL